MKVAVRHREGVCMAVGKRSLAYEDQVKTRCGYFVLFPWGLCRGHGAVTCHECLELERAQQATRSATQGKVSG